MTNLTELPYACISYISSQLLDFCDPFGVTQQRADALGASLSRRELFSALFQPLLSYIAAHCVSHARPSLELGHAPLFWRVRLRLLNFSHGAQASGTITLLALDRSESPSALRSLSPSGVAQSEVLVMAHFKDLAAVE